MGKFRFKPEMFPGWNPKHLQAIAYQANAALDEHLKGLMRVYTLDSYTSVWYETLAADYKCTALLFDVEELNPKMCEHTNIKQYKNTEQFKCQDCGKNLVAKLVEV